MMKRRSFDAFGLGLGAAGLLALTAPVHAGPPKDPPTKCAPDAVLAGTACVDKYEASVWLVPPLNLAGKSNKGLIKAIRKGKADLADLTAGNATQLGCVFAPFNHAAYPVGFPGDGNWVPAPAQPVPPSPGVYAVSIPGVLPSACTTWFQAEQACALSGKRLASNQEWQRAAAGTKDPGANNGLVNTMCNTSAAGPRNTGLAGTAPADVGTCVSAWGAEDLVGNVWEWVGDWGDRGTGPCTDWTSHGGVLGGDWSCVGGDGVAALANIPSALFRGGNWSIGTDAGVFAINAFGFPSFSADYIGLRCAR